MGNFKQELIKKILFALLALAIPIGIMIFMGWDIERRAEGVKDQRQELSNRFEELSLYAKLQSQEAEAEPYTGILQNILPTRDQLFDFQKETERLAIKEGVGFGFNFGNEVPPSAGVAGRMGFYIATEGSLFKVFKFVKAMEDGRFLIDFKGFDFTGSAVNINGEVLFY